MILDYVELMLWPTLAAFVLTGIHVYLGLHVVTRGVIFVDLALAQIAALGMTVGVLMGLGEESVGLYFTALLFTFIGAGLFALTREIQRRFNQEAIIGISYVVAAATMILLLSKMPEGGEHLNHLLVGSILFATPFVVIKTAILYTLIGTLHFVYRRQFMTVSGFKIENKGKPIMTKFWDFLFYMSFGFVVTSSVQIAGVFLVFSYLIIPSVAALLFFKGIRQRLFFGWSFGVVGSLGGMLLSVILDLPTGASIVVTFGILLILVVIYRALRPAHD